MKTKRVIQLLLVLALVFGLMAAGTISASAASKTPAQVKSVKVTAVKDTSISLSWAKAKDAKKYEVQYKKSSSKKWKSKKTTSKKVTVKSLKADTKYNFKVRGINGSKKGKFSKTESQKTFKTPGKVDPHSIFASERSQFGITLEWDKAKNATGYEVSIGQLNRKIGIPVQKTTTNKYTSSTVKIDNYYPWHFSANTWYEFYVRSVNSNTGKFAALKSSWTGPFYANTTTGGRIITGAWVKETGHDPYIAYKMNDTFVIGVDDGLIPGGLFYHEYVDGHGIDDVWYTTDQLYVDSVTFPADFTEKHQRYVFGAPDDSGFNGRTIKVGDTLTGEYYGSWTVKAIRLCVDTGDYGDKGFNWVEFVPEESDVGTLGVSW